LEWRGRTIVVYNAHLESRSTHVEQEQLQEILDDAKRYPESTPIVLAGDLNTKYDAKDASAKLRELGWHSALGDRTPKTHKILFSLDWILIHGPLKIDAGQVEHGTHGSDHNPIVATISIS
jgi:endonuclease/exonuclease/phosphatase family metal-dependent hydrolase